MIGCSGLGKANMLIEALNTIKNTSYSWFDVAVLGLLVLGSYRGRKNGMSGELLPLFQALAIVVACSFAYEPLGRMLVEASPIFGLLFAFITSYILIALFIKFFIDKVKRAAGEKLTGSDVFGRGEYYFGMIAGTLRFACFILIFLALLNARAYTDVQLADQRRFQQENFGDIAFPTPITIQHDVLTRSLTGRLIREHLSTLLIQPTEPDHRPLRRPDSMSGTRERTLDAVISESPPQS
jgi:hypothetical protein